MNQELRGIFEADQEDRKKKDELGWEIIMPRDTERLHRVRELISEGALEDKDDYFHAALIFQHGQALEDFLKAHELAMIAARMGHEKGEKLSQLALDRYKLFQKNNA